MNMCRSLRQQSALLLIFGWGDKRQIHIFSKSTCVKVNTTASVSMTAMLCAYLADNTYNRNI